MDEEVVGMFASSRSRISASVSFSGDIARIKMIMRGDGELYFYRGYKRCCFFFKSRTGFSTLLASYSISNCA